MLSGEEWEKRSWEGWMGLFEERESYERGLDSQRILADIS